jgi:hypothetical protein
MPVRARINASSKEVSRTVFWVLVREYVVSEAPPEKDGVEPQKKPPM